MQRIFYRWLTLRLGSPRKMASPKGSSSKTSTLRGNTETLIPAHPSIHQGSVPDGGLGSMRSILVFALWYSGLEAVFFFLGYVIGSPIFRYIFFLCLLLPPFFLVPMALASRKPMIRKDFRISRPFPWRFLVGVVASPVGGLLIVAGGLGILLGGDFAISSMLLVVGLVVCPLEFRSLISSQVKPEALS